MIDFLLLFNLKVILLCVKVWDLSEESCEFIFLWFLFDFKFEVQILPLVSGLPVDLWGLLF